MHRCGTSMVAGILAKCGYDFGSASELLPANQSNSLGYFENEKIAYRVNDAIFSHFGGSWHNPPELPPGWQSKPELEHLRSRAKAVVDSYGGHQNWAWKDPRASLLVPFWEQLVPDMTYIICVRNPIDVARSLQQRDGLSMQEATGLWHQYVSSALAQTSDSRRIIVFYEDFFEAPRAALTKLLEFLDVPHQPKETELEKSIFQRLRHHQTTLEELELNAEISLECKQLYISLRKQYSMGFQLTDGKKSTDESRGLGLDQSLESNLIPASTAALTDALISKTVMVFPKYQNPLVSIVIPTYNKLEVLISCLRTVLQFTDVPYQLIVVNDASTDGTAECLEQLENVTVVHNEQNLDFLRSANIGVDHAQGKYILFLNNDVSVRANWLQPLIDTFTNVDKCGAVGTKLIGMDGRLQEAGAAVWQDGTVSLYGAGDNPFKPEYSYPRETDYCSAACLLVRRDLFEELGKFDERFIPAYYEDVDFCLTVWASGYKVIYQPQVAVFHHHMASRTIQKVKSMLETNRAVFVEKWQSTLQARSVEKNSFYARNRYLGKRIAVIGGEQFGQLIGRSGTNCFADLLALASSGYALSVLCSSDLELDAEQIDTFQDHGIEVFYDSSFDSSRLLEERNGQYDYFVCDENQHPHIGMLIETLYPDATLLEISELGKLSVAGE